MAGCDPDMGTTRRLPSWMLAPPADDSVNNSEDRVNKAEHLDDAVGSKPQSTRKPKTLALHRENETPEDKQDGVAEGIRKRGKRKGTVQNAVPDGETREIVAEGKVKERGAKRVKESAPRGGRRSKRKQPIPVPEDHELSGITCADGDDDLDLTVEDLMSIANEYVSAKRDLEGRKLSRGESASEISTPEMRNVQVDPVNATSSEPKPPSTSISIIQDSFETVTREETVAPPIERTGDPAQDMLNLLLGPLLNKRVNEEKKKDELSTNSIVFPEEVSQSQSQDPEVVGEAVPKQKKKKTSSLKDKIAMFLE